MRRIHYRLLFGIATVALATLAIGACAPAGPVTYEEALEIHDSLEAVEAQLEDAEAALADLRAEEELPVEVGNVVADAAHEIDEAVATIASIREAVMPPPQEPIDDMPAEPAPADGGF